MSDELCGACLTEGSYDLYDSVFSVRNTTVINTGIMLSTLWNQSGIAKVGDNTTIVYNEYCPFISGTETHSVTGCTNTAAAQIIYYFIENCDLDLQLTLNADDAYTDDNDLQIKADGSTPGTISFAAINNKLAYYDLSSADDAAALTYACGVVQQASYGDSTSTAWSRNLFYRAGFESVNMASTSNALWGESGNISDAGFEILIENLTAGKVVGTSYPGHALVIDGYNAETDEFHINFGWGDSTSTAWYTRKEMNLQGYYNFIYDLGVSAEKDFFVTDSRSYGSGTVYRAFELAKGTLGDNTVNFTDEVAGKNLHLSQYIELQDKITVNDFNMNLMVSGISTSYGFYGSTAVTAEFRNFSGNVIANGIDYARAFYFNSAQSLYLSTDEAIIYAGSYAVNNDYAAGAESVLESLTDSRENNSDIADFIKETIVSQYAVYGTNANDTLVFDNKTIVTGNISLANGDDSITVTDSSRIFGNIYLANGDDSITVTDSSRIFGNIDFSGGNNKITIDSNSSITGIFYNSASVEMLLTANPDDEAIFLVNGNVRNIVNYTFSIDITDASTGLYSLITASENSYNINSLSSISFSINAGTGENFSLSINGTADCKYAELMLVENSLVMRIKGYDPSDTVKPSVPGNLQTTIYGNSVLLDWSNATDNKLVEGYYFRYGSSAELSGEGTFVRESEAVISELKNGSYYYQVRAKDASGNLSEWSAVKHFTVEFTATPVTFISGGLLISSGTVLTGKEYSDATMNISSGGTAIRTVLAGDAVQNVFSSGVTSEVKISSGGKVIVSAYGNLKGAAIYDGGSAVISRSGSASNVTVSNGGTFFIANSGTASGIDVKSGGKVSMHISGSASEVRVSSGGIIGGFTLYDTLTTYHDFTLSALNVKNAVIQSGNYGYIYDGAQGENINILKGGTLVVSSGGSASIVYNPWRGSVNSSEGAHVTYLERTENIYYGGSSCGILSSGRSMNGINVAAQLEAHIFSGGVVQNSEIINGGIMQVFDGGTARNIQVNSRGSVHISGGSVDGAEVNKNGVLHLSGGAIVNTTVNSYGSVYISGGSAAKTVISNGSVYVRNGADAGDVQIHSGGLLYLNSGTSCSSLELYEGGKATINSGTLISSAILYSNAKFSVSEEAHVNVLRLTSSVESAYIYGSVTSAVVGSGCYLKCYGAATVDNVSVSSGGRLYFSLSEKAVDCNISMERGAVLVINSDCAAACDITINGTLRNSILSTHTFDMQNHKLTLDLRERFVEDAYMVDDLANVKNVKLAVTVSATQASGVYELARGAKDFTGSITVNCGTNSAVLTTGSSVTLGASTYSLAVNPSGFMHLTVENNGTNITPEVADYIPGTVSTDWVQASKYAKEHNKVIFACYGDPNQCGYAGNMHEYLLKDPEFAALAKEKLVILFETVPAGKNYSGSPSGYLLDADGNMLAYKSGFAATAYDAWISWLKLNLGELSGIYTISGRYIESYTSDGLPEILTSAYAAGAVIKNAAVQSGGYLYLLNAGSAENCTIESGGTVYVSSGGIANSTTVNDDGRINVSSGGTANNITINDSGRMNVSSGGTANSTTVNDNGRMYVSSGGTANSTTVRQNGSIYIYGNDTHAFDTLIADGAFMDVYSSAAVENTVIEQGGYVRVRDYGSAVSTLIQSGGSMYVHSSNGYAYDTVISGFGRVYDGAIMSKVTIASGGSFHLWRGGILKDVDIQYGGLLDIRESSSILSGKVHLAGQLDISYDHKTDFSGADIVIDMSERNASDDYSIINLNYIGNTTLSITVAANQARGIYKFASNASNFTGTVSVGTDSKTFGTLTVGGAAIEYGDYQYSLVKDGKNINFTVVALRIPAPQVKADITTPTRNNVTLSAVFDEFSVERQFRIDGGEWQNCSGTVSVSRNCKVEFRCRDAQNVYSAITTYHVTNIDTAAPVLTLISNTEIPARNALITAKTDDGSAIYYSRDRINWELYKKSVSVTENGVWFFKAEDKAGNISEQTIIFNNIDPDAPNKPVAVADITAATKSTVTVTAIFTANAVAKQYSLDGTRWQSYANPISCGSNTTIYFREIDVDGNISEITEYHVNNIDKSAPEIPAVFGCFFSGNTVTISWAPCADTGLAGTSGYYYRYGKSLLGTGTFTEENSFTIDISDMKAGTYYYQIKSCDAVDNTTAWSVKQSFKISQAAGTDTALWTGSTSETYSVELTDSNGGTFVFTNAGNSVNLISAPEFDTTLNAFDTDNTQVGAAAIHSDSETASARHLKSDSNGIMDLFFARANGTWDAGYAAQHNGSDLSGGTGELCILDGKNKLADIFEGSTDANILAMTDDANGDALFVDDIYSALPGSIAEQQARIAGIDEIRAGDGDDIVDMTSQQFACTGGGIRIFGGNGNDCIWANNGRNTLYGDAGNDRLVGGADDDIIIGGSGNDSMHGGGGDDIFTFGGSWGSDTVEQIATGSVTLWFEEGDESCWNAATFTYSDGVNSVSVSGVTGVTLKFGADLQLPEGAFADSASGKIFEDKDKGILA